MRSEKRPCHSPPASVTYGQRQEPRKNDIRRESDGLAPKTKKKCLDLWPVMPSSSGEGLPYAPIDWPCPGDTWGWRVGRRITRTGFFRAKFLYPPRHLQKPGWPLFFVGRTSLEQYIGTEFPGADVDAFFASFSWKVLASKRDWPEKRSYTKRNMEYWSKGSTAPCPRRREEKDGDGDKEVITIDLTEETETSNSLTKDSRCAFSFENDQVSSNPNCVSSVHRSIGPSISPRHSHAAHKQSVMHPSSHALENEMVEARMKLSFLLAMDFPVLISTENLTELTNVLSMLQKDSRLTLDQRLKLQMIEEIPLNAKHFLETKKYIEDADDFSAELETNLSKVVSLNKEYNQSKLKTAQRQAEINSNLSAMREIEDLIAQFQSRYAELADDVELKKVEKNKLISAQTKVIDSLSSTKKQEWEQKKANAAKRVAEILAKYELLKEFSL